MTRGVWGEREERWLRERYAYEHAPQLVAKKLAGIEARFSTAREARND